MQNACMHAAKFFIEHESSDMQHTCILDACDAAAKVCSRYQANLENAKYLAPLLPRPTLVLQGGRTKQPIFNETKPPILQAGQNHRFQKCDKTADFKVEQNRQF